MSLVAAMDLNIKVNILEIPAQYFSLKVRVSKHSNALNETAVESIVILWIHAIL